MKKDLQMEYKQILEKIEKEFENIIEENHMKEWLGKLLENKNISEIDHLYPEILIEAQSDKNVKELLSKLKLIIEEYKEINDSLDWWHYNTFSLDKSEMEKRKDKLNEVNRKYVLYGSQEETYKNYLCDCQKILDFIDLKKEIEEKISENNEREVDFKEYKDYF